MRRVIIIQARMGSERLPGKVLMTVGGRPMLEHQVRRLQQCTKVDAIVLATTVNPSDDPLADLAQRLGVHCYRGSEHDVLIRYIGAARESSADVVVRVTADCPLIEPSIVDEVIDELVVHSHSCDYASNVLQRSFPRGLDVEALYRDTLERIARMATSRPAREHVTYFLTQERPDLFSVRSVTDVEDNSDLRWTVDTAEDLAVIREIYDALDLGAVALPYSQTLRFVRSRPDIIAVNAACQQKAR
jgi:spore coat polysaccharide biosynthesis protein SpsF